MENIISIASQVIAKASRDRPADSVLREELRKQKGLWRQDAREISGAVFSYYRWYGWLDTQAPLERNLRTALDLSRRFSIAAKNVSNDELLAKAVPPWVKSEVTASSAWARSLQEEPKLWLRAKPGKRDELARVLGDCSRPDYEKLSDAIEYRGTEDLFRSPEFQNGDFEVQDISSQAVGIVCDPKPGQTWWDACAGEGGKTLHFSVLMENKGLIWSSDRADWRLKKLKQRTARAKAFNYRTAPWDGSAKLPTKTKFDGILVDAPCSGIGTWQRNPHARWTTTTTDVRELAEIQKRLLSNAAGSLKPGGKLVYSVCTLARAETDEVASFFDSTIADLKPLPLINPFAPKDTASERLWFRPEICGGNGMFVAAWTKPA